MPRLSAVPVLAVLAALVSACGSSPASPSRGVPGTVAPALSAAVKGRTVCALSGAPLPSVSITTGEGTSATTDGDGAFELKSRERGICAVVASGPEIVRRETEIRMGGGQAELSLIPARFDLAAFDEMLRSTGALRRWAAAPSLVIIDAVLQFTDLGTSRFVALAERLTPDERASLAADLGWGLPQATGGAFTAFASVSVESPPPGAQVDFFAREGSIVVARFRGLSRTGYWGYGRAASRNDEVVAGAVMLDRDFELLRGPSRRSLRLHELGHALGYLHVTRRQSFMNATAVWEPNDFDRDATRIAFSRLPGNVAPDRDPARSASGGHAAAARWDDIMP